MPLYDKYQVLSFFKQRVTKAVLDKVSWKSLNYLEKEFKEILIFQDTYIIFKGMFSYIVYTYSQSII